MRSGSGVLVDAGPLVAILDADDAHHPACVSALRGMRGPLFTVWPVVTEAMYLLAFSESAQRALLEWLESGSLAVLETLLADISRIKELLHKYRDLPMDFADAAIVTVAEREGIRDIFTVDSRDFRIYKPRTFRHFNVIPAP